MTLKAPSSSDLVDPNLGFPSEHPDRVDVICNNDASRRKWRQRHHHRTPRPQSGAIIDISRVVPFSRLAGPAWSLTMKTYAAAGTSAEILHRGRSLGVFIFYFCVRLFGCLFWLFSFRPIFLEVWRKEYSKEKNCAKKCIFSVPREALICFSWRH